MLTNVVPPVSTIMLKAVVERRLLLYGHLRVADGGAGGRRYYL